MTRLAIAWLVATAWICTGCSSHNDEPDVEGVKVYFKVFTGSIPEENTTSRADDYTWHNPDNREEGTDFENAIRSITFYLSSKKGSVEQLSALIPLMVHGPLTDPTGHTYFECIGQVKPEDLSKLTGTSCRLTAMVNSPSPANFPATMQDLSVQKYNVEPFGHEKAYIPMWGVTTFQFPQVASGEGKKITLADPLYLLRAVAKIEVVLNMNDPDEDPGSFAGTGAYFDCEDATGAFTPGKCYMTPCLDRGYVMAIGGLTANDTRDLNMYNTNAVMPPDEVNKIPQHTINTLTPRQQKLEFYVPPYQPSAYHNISLTYPASNPYQDDARITGYLPQVRVFLSGPDHESVQDVITLDMVEKEGIEAGSLQRNHLYRITLNRAGVSGLRFHATIADMLPGGTIEFEYGN